MTKVKYCPIMSYQKQYHDEMYCMENDCAFWDEEKGQCCIKTMALAAAAKPAGGSNTIPMQAEYVYPISATPAVLPNSSGDWNPPHYTITCDLGEIIQ